MKMTDKTDHDDPLAEYFDAARARAPELRPQSRARILAAARPEKRRQARQGWRVCLKHWAAPSLAGLATAMVAGVWIGAVMPLPVAAYDAPVWVLDAFSYFDLMTAPIVGMDDLLLIGF